MGRTRVIALMPAILLFTASAQAERSKNNPERTASPCSDGSGAECTLPPELPYKEGQLVPRGYHIEDVPRQGLVTAGYIVTAIPYGLSVFTAMGANFENETQWLAVPFAGPWLTMGRRNYGCDEAERDAKHSAECVGDVFAVMGLVMDGVVQAAGGSFLLAGYLATKQKLVRDEEAVRVVPARMGSGHGVVVFGTF